MLENHTRFLERAVASETVWGLRADTGYVWCDSNEQEGRDVILFWSDRAWVEQARGRDLAECTIEAISLFDFLLRWLPEMSDDGAFAGTNWTADLAGTECDPVELQQQLLDRMPPEMIARYQDQLQQGLDEQDASG